MSVIENAPSRPALTFREILEMMRPDRAENIPSGRLFSTQEEKELAPINPAQLMQISTDVAAACGEIVKKTAIQSEQARTALLSTPCEPFIGLALYGPGLLVTGLC